MPVVGGRYCVTCGYTTLFPTANLGGAGTSTSNDQFKTGSNYPLGGTAYFTTPTYTAFQNADFGTTLPQSPGVRRNLLNGPGYRALNLTVSEGFGLPNSQYTENIANHITSPNFGRAAAALAARVVTLGARFNF